MHMKYLKTSKTIRRGITIDLLEMSIEKLMHPQNLRNQVLIMTTMDRMIREHPKEYSKAFDLSSGDKEFCEPFNMLQHDEMTLK